MTARSGSYVGLVPATASVDFPFVGNSTLHDGIPFAGYSTCSSEGFLLVSNIFFSSGEILLVENLTSPDSDQILKRHELVANDPSPSQSEIG